MTLKYFGKIAELTGSATEEWTLTEITVSKFKVELFAKHAILRGETLQIAVNLKIVEDSFVIKNNDTIAILPPFSGG